MTPEGAIDTAHTWAADAATPAHTRTVLTVLLEHLETVVGDCSDAIDEVTWMQAEIAAVTRHLRAVEHARDVLASALRGSHEATDEEMATDCDDGPEVDATGEALIDALAAHIDTHIVRDVGNADTTRRVVLPEVTA